MGKWGYRMQSAPTVSPERVLHKALCEKRWQKFRERFFDGILDIRDYEGAKCRMGGLPVVPSSRQPRTRTARFRLYASRTRKGSKYSTGIGMKSATVEPTSAVSPGFGQKDRPQSEPAPYGGQLLNLATLSSGIHGMHPGWCSSVVEKWLSGTTPENAVSLGLQGLHTEWQKQGRT